MNELFLKRRNQMLRLRTLRENHGVKETQGELTPPCPSCGTPVEKKALSRAMYVCPHCGYHHAVGAWYRLKNLLDAGSIQEMGQQITAADPLEFPGYVKKLSEASERSGLPEAVVTVIGRLQGQSVAVGVLDSRFLMGSMGSAVGERLTVLIEYAARHRLPLIIFSASGGARMQEGILSLMQMAKTAAALQRFQEKGGLYISVLTHPTTGGVTASFASLGDIILAEPGALIGFAGPRVIRQTIGQTLPPGFQRAEFLQDHGFVDRVVPRRELKEMLETLLRLHEKGKRR